MASYAYQGFDKSSMARAQGANLKISYKRSVETLRAIKGKKVSSAINFLEGVIEQTSVVPYKRFNQEMPHKRGKGIAAGGYPVNVAKEVLRLVQNASKNASEQELTETLYVISASARKGTKRYHMGRNMGQEMKSTNVEVILGPKGGAQK